MYICDKTPVLFFESEIILRPSFYFETWNVVFPIYGPHEA